MYAVLHIDNSSFFRNILKDLFEKNGFKFLEASNTIEAEAILESVKRINLIITSMELEGESGIEFIKKISLSKHKEIPVIVITSSDSLEVRQELFHYGIIDYIPKHTPAPALIEYIDRLYVERLRSEDELSRRLRHMKIAVLDDSAVEISIIKNILEYHQIKNVTYYSDPQEFLQDRTDYSIYLLDMILPHISGEQVILDVKQRNKDAMIIAISGIDHYKAISNVLLAGADDYITKPFNVSIFMAKLKASARVSALLDDLKESRNEMTIINRELKRLVVMDSLTGLYNHRFMYERLEKEIQLARENGTDLSVLMLDIDFFKKINDGYGHQAGDKVLTAAAKLLRDSSGPKDVAGRYGGEEFMVIFPGKKSGEAMIEANNIRKKFAALTYPFIDRMITVSGGVSDIRKSRNAIELVHNADRLLYKAKNMGRNRIAAEKSET
jgi:two-component system, cell cycle response regulator